MEEIGFVSHAGNKALFGDRTGLKWQQAPGELLWKSFRLVVCVGNGHVHYSLRKTFKLQIRMCLDEAGQESLETCRRQTWHVRYLVKLSLHEMMLALEPAEHHADRCRDHAAAKN
jgi:hypothetical protein